MQNHRWDVTPAQAREIQQSLCTRVRFAPLPHGLRTVAGLDVHGDRGAVAMLAWPSLEWVGGAVAERHTTFPYVPGLLSFREIPALLAAIERLETLPDLLLCDGHGLAHPRRFGLACHLGVLLERPTVGCAKTLLCGHHDALALTKGATVPLQDGASPEDHTSPDRPGEVIGAVLRTQTGVRPVYVSVGHLVELADAVEVVLHCASRYRLPEPLRLAHTMAKTGHNTPTSRDLSADCSSPRLEGGATPETGAPSGFSDRVLGKGLDER